jgi:hypothetical protein
LTDKNLPWTEKLFWAFALAFSLILCGFLINVSYIKWKSTPVIVSFSETFINVWEVPFPAVTICPLGGTYPLSRSYDSTAHDSSPALINFPGLYKTSITDMKWQSEGVDSTDAFTEIATKEGFCYTFNMLRFEDMFQKDV